ncbi:MAG: tRNA (guanine(10)-N(2))-dimethyltransferase [Candidatus Bathyarchaeia archaeon]
MDFPTEIVCEGEVKVLVPKLEAFVKSLSKAPVFYNPVMEFNRDLAVLALQAYQRTVNCEITVCEPLAGCGVRGIRFAKEVKGIKNVLINDINPKAFKLAKCNVEINGLGGCITVKNEDANFLLSGYGAPRKRFDAIDVDPFGSPVPYLDSAIRALKDRGFLALTATDTAPLCGVYPKACMRKYGGKPLRTEYCHELAVRLLVGCLATTAAKHDMGVNVLFSHSTDHYVRLYAKIEHGAKKADASLENMGYVLHCFDCFHRETIKEPFHHSGKCGECGSKLGVAGPLWLGKIVDGNFCSLMMEELRKRTFRLREKLEKILNLTRSEADAPITYYVIDKICDKLAMPTPPIKKVCEALENEGFQATLTHFTFKGLRTNASATAITKLLRRTYANMTSFK